MNKLSVALAASAIALHPALVSAGGHSDGGRTLSFTKLWTYQHETPGQLSEIPAFDPRTHTLWIAGVVGVDVLDATSGALIEHIPVTDCGTAGTDPCGNVNSVAIHDGIAAFAIEASPDREAPGFVTFYDTRSRKRTGAVQVGALPDMLTFTDNGRKLLVANEGTPNVYGTRVGTSVPWEFGTAAADPIGTVSIIDVKKRSVIATPSPAGVPLGGSLVRTNTGMDFEPEYIAVDPEGRYAYVTLQEANAVGVLDLRRNAFVEVIGLGAKDFSRRGNQIDPLDNGIVEFIEADAKGLFMPDGIAAYKWRGRTMLVMANEGDFREDDADRIAASTLGAVAPLNRLRVSATESSPDQLYSAGARSFSIRDQDGRLVYDSGNTLDKEAFARGIYDDGRSRDKGVEPEGIALHEMRGRTYAFVGLERTTKSAIAVFDVSDPYDVEFIDMIVTEGSRSPEGLVTYRHRGDDYLAIAHEVSNTTVLYRIDRERGRRRD